MEYAKYDFEIVPDFDEMDIQGSVLNFGKLWQVEPTYDQDGNLVTAGVINTTTSVDILYNDVALPELESYRIYPKTPYNYISGMENEYLKTIK